MPVRYDIGRVGTLDYWPDNSRVTSRLDWYGQYPVSSALVLVLFECYSPESGLNLEMLRSASPAPAHVDPEMLGRLLYLVKIEIDSRCLYYRKRHLAQARYADDSHPCRSEWQSQELLVKQRWNRYEPRLDCRMRPARRDSVYQRRQVR
jgi:hypothetical protein